MSRVATQLGELRDAVNEIRALAARAAEPLDHAPWSRADPVLVDPVLVELLAYVFGEIARLATRAASKLDGLRGAVASAQPAPAGERRGLRGAVASAQPAPAGERRDGKGPAPDEVIVLTEDGLLVRRRASYSYEADVVKRLRELCAAAFKRPVDFPFFRKAYMPGETPDQALWRIFWSEKLVRVGWRDGEVMEVLIYGNELPIPEEFAPAGPGDDESAE